jgi:hypothetical protein
MGKNTSLAIRILAQAHTSVRKNEILEIAVGKIEMILNDYNIVEKDANGVTKLSSQENSDNKP